MPRLYTAPLDAISVTNDGDQDIFQLASPASTRVVLHAFSLTSAHTTDERVRLRLIQRTAAGTGGSAVTVLAADRDNGVSFGGTLNSLVTTPGTGSNILAGWQWSQQGELLFLPTPETRPTISASSFLCLNLQTAMGGTRTWSGYVVFEAD